MMDAVVLQVRTTVEDSYPAIQPTMDHQRPEETQYKALKDKVHNLRKERRKEFINNIVINGNHKNQSDCGASSGASVRTHAVHDHSRGSVSTVDAEI